MKAILCIAVALAFGPAAAQAPPAFDVATIKPVGPNSRLLGFYAYPGGRILLGYLPLKRMIQFAYGVQEFQISGGPAWVSSDRYDVVAMAPPSAETARPNQPPVRAIPTPLEQTMMQTLLADRFGLRIRREQKEGPVYLLERGASELLLKKPEDETRDQRGGIMTRVGGIVDGTAFGTNISMGFLAYQLGGSLGRTVIDRTGLTGRYDFRLEAYDLENRDLEAAVFKDMERLGLKLKAGRGPVDTIVVEAATRPTEN